MKFNFKAKICKTGINPYVSVPLQVTRELPAVKGYIPIKGKINDHPFTQTLVPVKNAKYRLFVNGPMLKGTGLTVGKTAAFTIEHNQFPVTADTIAMPPSFKKQLDQHKLLLAFRSLGNYRQKEILRYLNNLKTQEALQRNIDKVIVSLQKKQRDNP